MSDQKAMHLASPVTRSKNGQGRRRLFWHSSTYQLLILAFATECTRMIKSTSRKVATDLPSMSKTNLPIAYNTVNYNGSRVPVDPARRVFIRQSCDESEKRLLNNELDW